MIGKKIRLDRIKDRDSNKFIILPIDHGVTYGPIHGIHDIKQVVEWAVNGGATAIVEHKGMVIPGYRGKGKDIGLIVHLSASTYLSPYPDTKTIVGTVEEAVKLGADAVSIHVNIGNTNEKEMLKDFGKISKTASDWGMPLLAMIYARGKSITNEYDKKLVAHCARLGAELGADVVKVPYTGNVESFAEVVSSTHIPVIIAGGEKMDSVKELINVVAGAVKAGAAGISIGRNIFQSEKPDKLLNILSKIVKESLSAEEAYQNLLIS